MMGVDGESRYVKKKNGDRIPKSSVLLKWISFNLLSS